MVHLDQKEKKGRPAYKDLPVLAVYQDQRVRREIPVRQDFQETPENKVLKE